MGKRETTDAELFDPGDVTWEVVPSRNRNEMTVRFKSETSFNLIKFYLTLQLMSEKIEADLNIMDEAEGMH